MEKIRKHLQNKKCLYLRNNKKLKIWALENKSWTPFDGSCDY
jgi:hypothetical protein